MNVTVIGGTGLIGAQLVSILRSEGHQADAVSVSSGVNAETGEGLASAVARAEVVVDVVNTMDFERVGEFFHTTTTNILAAAKEASVAHYVALSIVGTQEVVGNAYLDAKRSQEDLILRSGRPYSILEATQFFEFVPSLAWAGTVDGRVHASQALVQPIASADVAAELARIAVNPAVNGIIQIAGPQRFTLAEFLGAWLTSTGDRRELIREPHYSYFGTAIDEHSLVPSEGTPITAYRFDEWMKGSAGPATTE